MSAWRSGAALGLLFSAFGCTAFPAVETDVCGNAVVERPREDCDTFAEEGKSCRPPGSDGECHYDCRVNADGVRPQCPKGSGCAADGICREPTGGFDAAVNFASDPSSWVSTADFDGDHKLDVISTEPTDEFEQARFRLHYFDADAKLVESKTFPRPTTRPVACHVTGGTGTDFLFSNFRVGLLPGRRDREWVPAAFSSYVVADSDLRLVGALDDFVSDASPLVALTTINGVTGAYTPDSTSGGLGLRFPLTRPVRELVGAPIAANLVEGFDSPCLEVVLAYRGARDFTLYDMCRPGDEHLATRPVEWRDAPEAQVVKLPPGLVVDAAPLAADVDGDGHLDILIGAGGHPYVAHGDGRKLEPVASSFEIEFYEDGAYRQVPSLDRPMPLAAGDYSGDGVADFIEPTRLVTSRKLSSGTNYFSSYPNRGDAWTMAEIADLNGNGLPDVVAAAQGTHSLAFFNGTGGPFQIGTTLATQGPVRLLTTGDFDGDLLGDIAFLQDGAGDASDSLALAFGARDATPLPATRVAELSGVEQLGNFASMNLGNLFVASNERVDGVQHTKLTLFDDGPDRLPFAPYSLVTFSTDGGIQDSSAAVIVAGQFTQPGVTDVIALGAPKIKPKGEQPKGANDEKNYEWRAWLLADIGSGKQQPRLLAGKLQEGVAPLNAAAADRRTTLGVVGTAADVDGDGLDESLWLASRAAAGCSLFVASVDADAGTFSDVGHVDFDEPCPSPELAAADLDGDHALDLLVLIGDPGQKPRRLELLWNDGQGKFSAGSHSSIAAPKGRDVRGFSAFTGLPQRLALISDKALFVATSTTDHGRDFDLVTPLQAFDDARSVVVTDPNDDSIEDLVVADAAGLWLLKAHLR